MSDRVQFRRDTKARWEEVNPVLMEGEMGLEIDTNNIKMGDGVHAWNELEYGVGIENITSESGNSENLAASQKLVNDKFNDLSFTTDLGFLHVADANNFVFEDFTVPNAHQGILKIDGTEEDNERYMVTEEIRIETIPNLGKYIVVRNSSIFFSFGYPQVILYNSDNKVVGSITNPLYEDFIFSIKYPIAYAKVSYEKNKSTVEVYKHRHVSVKATIGKDEIVQTIGTSTSNVMSQKAVTDSNFDNHFFDVQAIVNHTSNFILTGEGEAVETKKGLLRDNGTVEDYEGYMVTDFITSPSKNIFKYIRVQNNTLFDEGEYAQIVFYDDKEIAVAAYTFPYTFDDDVIFPIGRYFRKCKVSGGQELKVTIYTRDCVKKRTFADEKNKWENKKILCIGDSITDNTTWVEKLKAIVNPSAIYNRGVGGTIIAGGSKNSFCNRADLEKNDGAYHYLGFPTEADLIIILGGVNDWGFGYNSIPFGDIKGSISKSTFCGAVKYLITKLKADYPNARIVTLLNYDVYSTYGFMGFSEIEYTESETDGAFEYVTHNGKTFNDYRNAISDISKMYGVATFDLRNVGFSFFCENDRSKYAYLNDGRPDGLHPNENGDILIANYIASCINGI